MAVLPFGPALVVNEALAMKLQLDWPGTFDLHEVRVLCGNDVVTAFLLRAAVALEATSDARIAVTPCPSSGEGIRITRVSPGLDYPAAFRVTFRPGGRPASEYDQHYEKQNFINDTLRLWWKRNRVGNSHIFPAIGQPGHEELWSRWWAENAR